MDEIAYTEPPRYAHFTRLNCPRHLPHPLHRAIYNGRTAKVARLIAAPTAANPNAPSLNIYTPCESATLDISALQLAVACDHIEIAHQLIDIYEADIHSVRTHMLEQGADPAQFNWMPRPTLVGYGRHECDELRPFLQTCRVRVTPAILASEKPHGQVVLLKEHNYAAAEVFWVHPTWIGQVAECAALVRRLVRTGRVEFHSDNEDYNEQYLAARRNHVELYMRLVKAYGHLATGNRDYFDQLLHLVSFRRTRRINYMLHLAHRLGAWFRLEEHVCNKRAVLLRPLVVHRQRDVFMFLADGLAAADECDMAAMLRRPEDGGRYVCDLLDLDRLDEAVWLARVIRPDLLEMCESRVGLEEGEVRVGVDGADLEERGIVLVELMRQTVPVRLAPVMAGWFCENLMRMQVLGAELWHDVLLTLFAYDSVETLALIFERSPSSRNILFQGEFSCEDCERLLQNIDEDHYQCAEFILDIQRDDFNDSDVCSELILRCSEKARAFRVLQLLLQVPGTVSLAASPKYYMPLLSHALNARMTENFGLLWAHFAPTRETIANLPTKVTTDWVPGKMLASAVWCRRLIDMDVAEPSQRPIYSLDHPWEMVDSDDDDEVGERKAARNRRQEVTRQVDEIVPQSAEFYADEERRYQRLFVRLANRGLDVKWITNLRGETLAHLAMRRNNLFVLEEVIRRGLDVWQTDCEGRTPLHCAHAPLTLQRLLQCDGAAQQVDRLDDHQDTALHRYLYRVVCGERKSGGRVLPRLEPDPQVVRMLLAAGADVNLPNGHGLRPVMLAAENAVLVRVIAGEAAAYLGTRDDIGKATVKRMGECAELLQCAGDRIDWLESMTLQALVRLSARETERIREVLDTKHEVLRAVFRKQFTGRYTRHDSLLARMVHNPDMVRRFVHLLPRHIRGAQLGGLVYRFDGPGGRQLAEWMYTERGVNFCYLWRNSAPIYSAAPSIETWQTVLRLDADGALRKHFAAEGHRLMESLNSALLQVAHSSGPQDTMGTVDVVTHFVEAGALWRTRSYDLLRVALDWHEVLLWLRRYCTPWWLNSAQQKQKQSAKPAKAVQPAQPVQPVQPPPQPLPQSPPQPPQPPAQLDSDLGLQMAQDELMAQQLSQELHLEQQEELQQDLELRQKLQQELQQEMLLESLQQVRDKATLLKADLAAQVDVTTAAQRPQLDAAMWAVVQHRMVMVRHHRDQLEQHEELMLKKKQQQMAVNNAMLGEMLVVGAEEVVEADTGGPVEMAPPKQPDDSDDMDLSE